LRKIFIKTLSLLLLLIFTVSCTGEIGLTGSAGGTLGINTDGLLNSDGGSEGSESAGQPNQSRGFVQENFEILLIGLIAALVIAVIAKK